MTPPVIFDVAALPWFTSPAPLSVATQVSHLPPVSTLFAALLGYNPVQNLLAPSGVLKHLPAHNVAVLTGKEFFPNLISAPFHHGLVIVFTAAAIMSFIGALVSLLRGKQFYYTEPAAPVPATVAGPAQDTAPNGNGAKGNRANGNGANGNGADQDTADQDAAARSARGGRG